MTRPRGFGVPAPAPTGTASAQHGFAADAEPTGTASVQHGFAADAELHRRDAPRHCPRCGESLTSGIAVEYWQGADRVFHTWCASCRWTGDIIPVTTMIGHEPEH